MSDGSLSQEEIDALLSGADDLTSQPAPGPGGGGINEAERAELASLATEMSSSMGNTLATITGKTAQLSNPEVIITSAAEYIKDLPENIVQVNANITEGYPGTHLYIVTEDAAKQIASLMMAQEEGEITDMALSAISEAFNQMSGSASNVLEEKTGATLKIGDIKAELKKGGSELQLPEGSFVRIRYSFTSNGSTSFIDEVFDEQSAKGLATASLSKKGGLAAAPSAGAGVFEQTAQPASQPQQAVGAQPVQFAQLTPTQQQPVQGNIGLLMDVSMQLTVELGRTKMLIKDILAMGEGTIVELDKLAGEPVDLLVNGKLIAKGEVVVIDENFGVRVTDIISPAERISSLE